MLLHSKITPPRATAPVIPRPALLARFQAGLGRAVTLVMAPAGFGKTTLVTMWLAAQESDAPPVAWLSLDDGDNDPVRFWRYVFAACQQFGMPLDAALAALHEQRPALHAALTAFINDLAQLERHCVLVLEDYQHIVEQSVHDTLAFLLDHLPPSLHIVVLSRGAPPLPLARLRAQGQLTDFDIVDLRFSPEETRTFWEQTLATSVDDDFLSQLDEQAEGWPAGLRLLALASQGQADMARVFQSATRERYVGAYLITDVLDAQPPAWQHFLLCTSVLPRFCAALCDAVTEQTNGVSMLADLSRANVFLVQLDGNGSTTWYRYHALFAEALRAEAEHRLGMTAVQQCYKRASDWFDKHGFAHEAIEMALTAAAWPRAAAMIEKLIQPHGFVYEIQTLRRWVEQMPAAHLREHPAVCLAYALALLFTEDRRAPQTMARIAPLLQHVDEAWRGKDQRHGRVLAIRSMLAWWQSDLDIAFAAAREALALLPVDDVYWRGTSYINVGLEQLLNGTLAAAQRALAEGRRCCDIVGNQYGVRATAFILGEVYVQQAELTQAVHLYQHVLAEAQDDLLDQGHASIGMAQVAYERNNLCEAARHATQAIDLAQSMASSIGAQTVDDALTIPASLVLARIHWARGGATKAQQLLSAAAAQTVQHSWELLHRLVRAVQARMALAAGDVAAVQRWATHCAQQIIELPRSQEAQEALLVARMLLAQGNAAAALPALAHWRAIVAAAGRTRSVIEISMLQALAYAATADQTSATTTLLEALELACPAGLQRVFLDEGAPLAVLLRSLLPEVQSTPLANYMRQLLLAFDQQPVSISAVQMVDTLLLHEPLTP